MFQTKQCMQMRNKQYIEMKEFLFTLKSVSITRSIFVSIHSERRASFLRGVNIKHNLSIDQREVAGKLQILTFNTTSPR